ncbi:MAG TPA: adenylate/guanylate cyclase domain-containing protein [Pyrinomonadaceae bacterium]|jgi:class 3 adenylate cyclase
MEIDDEIDTLWDEAEDANKNAKQRLKSRIREILQAGRDRHRPAYDRIGTSNIVPILFMDIVGYSKLPTDDQQKYAIELLNRLVKKALPRANCTLDDVVCLPTGDGMCLCFNKITDGPLTVAAKVQQLLAKEQPVPGKPKVDVRMGVHSGNVLRVKDLKGSYNLAGAAINISQRAMNFGDEGHILCTEAAFAYLKLMKDYETAIKPIKGIFKAKHGVPLKLYNYHRLEKSFGNPKIPKK